MSSVAGLADSDYYSEHKYPAVDSCHRRRIVVVAVVVVVYSIPFDSIAVVVVAAEIFQVSSDDSVVDYRYYFDHKHSFRTAHSGHRPVDSGLEVESVHRSSVVVP